MQPVSGMNRDVDMRSVREIRRLIGHLERQGARVVWAKGTGKGDGQGVVGNFPAKVYPPDKTKHFILFHGSVSDQNAATIKRNEVRRAGLEWPGETSRKETPMSTAPASVVVLRAPGEHLFVPPGVANRKTTPTPSSVDAIKAVLESLPEEFWTDEAMAKVQAAGVPGYGGKGGAPMQRLQAMLDWRGFRVVDRKANRGGFSYRWFRDPAAPEREGVLQDQTANFRPRAVEAPAEVIEAKSEDALLAKLERDTGLAEPPLPAEAGPIAAAFADAQRRKAEDEAKRPKGFEVFDRTKGKTVAEEGADQPKTPESGETLRDRMHRERLKDRTQCVTCERWFTAEGYERHAELLGHGPQPEKGRAAVTQDAVDVANSEPAVPLQGTPVVDAGIVSPEVPLVPKADYDAMEALAQENEARANEHERELEQRDTDIERLQRELAEARRRWAAEKENAAISDGQRQQIAMSAAHEQRQADLAEIQQLRDSEAAAVRARGTIFTELQEVRAALGTMREVASMNASKLAEAEGTIAQLREQPAAAPADGSWVIPWDQVGQQWTHTIVENAAQLGVRLELRGYVAGRS